MKIEGPKNIYTSINAKNPSYENDPIAGEIKGTQLEDVKVADIFEKTIVADKLGVYDLLTIKNISLESKNIYSQLKTKIEDMVREQIKALELFKNVDETNITNIDKNLMNNGKLLQAQLESIKSEETQKDLIKSEASKANISKTDEFQMDKAKINEGDLLKSKLFINEKNFVNKSILDAESSSEEIVGFIKNVSDAGKGKLATLAEIVVEIFNDVEKTIERLPDISKKTYNRIMEKLDNLLVIEKFIDKPESVKAELRKIIEDTIIDQSKSYEIIKKFESSKMTDILKTNSGGIRNETSLGNEKALLLLQGQLGIKESSERILYFVRNASNGDKEKLSNLAKEINKSFKELEKLLGDLPEISKKTYKKIMEELNQDEELEEIMDIYSKIYAQFANIYKRAKDAISLNKWGSKQYIPMIAVSIILYYILKMLI